MASKIYLGNLFGLQIKMDSDYWNWEKRNTTNSGIRAVIAKGNTIEGIEAKE